jgi:endonuclease-3
LDSEAHDRLGQMIPKKRYYEVHVNLIRHGRKVCRPRDPLCGQCCLIDYCEYYAARY